MPIYEYECRKCGKSFEYMQSIKDPPKKKCEACGGKLEKMVSAAGFILKGGGWYKDLYASPKPGSAGGSSGGDSGEKSSSSEKADKPASTKPEKAEKSEKKPSKKGAKE